METASEEVAHKSVESNGEQTLLGWGFGTSKSISARGYRDGVYARSRRDMEDGIELITGEFDAHLLQRVDEIRVEISNCHQILAKSGGIAAAFDERYLKLIALREEQIDEINAERARCAQRVGQCETIRNAYRKGYANGMVNGEHSYLTSVGPNEK